MSFEAKRQSKPCSQQRPDATPTDTPSTSGEPNQNLPPASNLSDSPNISSTVNPTSILILPAAPNPPNPLPPTSLPCIRGEYIAEAISLVSPGTVNVVGHDQINVTHIHMDSGVSTTSEGKFSQVESSIDRNTRNLFSHSLLKNLSHVAKASYDASTPALRRACTENTRTAILGAITRWVFDSTTPKIYWMNGMAGTGKTTITYSLSIFLESCNILGATFFCTRLVDECTKVDRIFPTIAYHLARTYHPLASTILEVLKNDPDVANRAINRQFSELIVKPIRAASDELDGQLIVIVIDALDECANQTEVQTLLSVIFQRSSELPFKIFITSRPEQLVRVGFNRQNASSYSKFILHDIEQDVVNADIKLYTTERLVDMVDGRSDFQDISDDWPPDDKLDSLVHRANRLFIFAKTVCDYIGEPGGNISERLDAFASGETSGDTLDTSELDKLYRDILDRAVPRQPKDRDRLKWILSSVISVRNPLSACGLGTLLKIDPRVIKSSLASLHAVISVPQSLDAPVSTFHASFPDCLVEVARSHHHFLPPSTSHYLLAESCLSLMNSSLKENMCNLEGRPSNDAIANDTITTHISEGLAYACVYWASHLIAVGKEEIRDSDAVRQLLDVFLREHVLHWMECLSLLRQLIVGIESLRAIQRWVLNIYPKLSAMVMDARRFIIENFELIYGHCLETYHSALVWLPVPSIIRKHRTTQCSTFPKS